jgi:serine/threonine protein kinase
MAARRPDEFGGLPPTLAWRVDAVCQRFETGWRAGHEPRIEDFLSRADQPQRVALFRELLALELELRQGRGERPDLRAYHTRFPGHIAAIAAVFGPEPAAAGGVSAPRDVPDPRRLTEVPGSRISPYNLLRPIGEGGMGVVYMAEQEAPVRRHVALKIIKPGLDSDQVIARFEAERQALALMDHPHIAKVLDAGTTDTGRHYFVMELVEGIPITDYCDQNELTPTERLELFVLVCQAVQHAHQKGVIHRDIKPSNVLVTHHDGHPVPKVIDFGLAKAIDQRLTEQTLLTQFGQVIGTLEYMSPEQAELGALDIDTRCDIYSLGVLLYELLTGTTPLERARIREAGYAEILQWIKEEVPPNPSTRLSESRDALPSIAAHRKTEPARLTWPMRGELNWIAMKALEKDRTRRYETANGLMEDIRRYLAGDPVEAGPPSALYRARNFARKHRVGLATVAAFGAVLIGATAISTWQAVRATREENKADASRRLAEQAGRQAEARRVEADAQRKQAEASLALSRSCNGLG